MGWGSVDAALVGLEYSSQCGRCFWRFGGADASRFAITRALLMAPESACVVEAIPIFMVGTVDIGPGKGIH